MKLVRKHNGLTYDLILTIENKKDEERVQQLCCGVSSPLACALKDAVDFVEGKIDCTYYIGHGR